MGTVEKRISTTVALHDKAEFLKLLMAEFNAPHIGNAVRFGIRPLSSHFQSLYRNGSIGEGHCSVRGGPMHCRTVVVGGLSAFH